MRFFGNTNKSLVKSDGYHLPKLELPSSEGNLCMPLTWCWFIIEEDVDEMLGWCGGSKEEFVFKVVNLLVSGWHLPVTTDNLYIQVPLASLTGIN